MTYEITIALSLMRSQQRFRVANSNVFLSTSGIIIGVAVLILTLTIYDGYIQKLETIIFSIFPQVAIKSTSGLLPDKNQDELDYEAFLYPTYGDTRKNCLQVCNGENILSDSSSDNSNTVESSYMLNPQKYQAIIESLSESSQLKKTSPVILEEAKFEISIFSKTNNQKMEDKLRVLGISINSHFIVPEVHRLMDSVTPLENLKQPDTVILSDILYEKIFGKPFDSNNVNSFSIKLHLTSNIESEQQESMSKKLKVVGTFKLGIHKVADNMLITSIDTADKLLNMSEHVSMIGVSLHQPMQADILADVIRDKLDNDAIIETAVFNWRMFGDDIFNSMTLYRKMIIITLALSLIITAFNIYNNLSILILERQRQIGVMLAMGMKRTSIYKVFLIISQIEAIVGSILGIGLGLLIGFFFNDYLNQTIGNFLPVQQSQVTLNIDTSLGVIVFVCFVSALTAILSARRANNLDIVEALQAD